MKEIEDLETCVDRLVYTFQRAHAAPSKYKSVDI